MAIAEIKTQLGNIADKVGEGVVKVVDYAFLGALPAFLMVWGSSEVYRQLTDVSKTGGFDLKSYGEGRGYVLELHDTVYAPIFGSKVSVADAVENGLNRVREETGCNVTLSEPVEYYHDYLKDISIGRTYIAFTDCSMTS